MHDAHLFVEALTLVVVSAAVAAVLFQKLKLPGVLGYILAGVLIGPHVPALPLVADQGIVHALSELGVILLMASIGLEFSLRKLARVGAAAGLITLAQISVMMWLGLVIGRTFGWSSIESLYAGGMISISSTMIIARAFRMYGVGGHLMELVYGVLVLEDLAGILLMAILTAMAAGQGLPAAQMAVEVGALAFFLAAIVVVGLFLVPRAVRIVAGLQHAETLLVSALGLCFFAAWLASKAGYSMALGAFLGGALVAESGLASKIEHLMAPLRDVFAAVFFVSVGMMVDPRMLVEEWPIIVALTAAVVGGKIISVSLGAFFTGNDVRTSLRAGLSMAQIGEFSFIIAGLGVSLGVLNQRFYGLGVAVCVVTTLITPWLIRGSNGVAEWVEHRFPPRLQTFTTLYGSWVEQLRERRARPHSPRWVRLLLLDVGLLVAVLTMAGLGAGRMITLLAGLGLQRSVARAAVLVLIALFCVPLVVGLLRCARGVAMELADLVLPPGADGRPDLASAPRHAMVISLQSGLVLASGLLVIAIAQPLLPRGPLAVALVVLVLGLAMLLWRTMANLHGHMRAGSQVITEILGRQLAAGEEPELESAEALLPGLGSLKAVRLVPSSFAVGRTLADLHVRARTGATVVAVIREGVQIPLPSGTESFRSGDLVALSGSDAAVDHAESLLCSGVQHELVRQEA